MKQKIYERPTLYLLEICTADVISTSSTPPEEPEEETDTTYGPVDGGGIH